MSNIPNQLEIKKCESSLKYLLEGLEETQKTLESGLYSLEETESLIEHMDAQKKRIEAIRLQFLQYNDDSSTFNFFHLEQFTTTLIGKTDLIKTICLSKLDKVPPSPFSNANKAENPSSSQPISPKIVLNGSLPIDLYRLILSHYYKFPELAKFRKVCRTFKVLSEERIVALYSKAIGASSFNTISSTQKSISNALKGYCTIHSIPLEEANLKTNIETKFIQIDGNPFLFVKYPAIRSDGSIAVIDIWDIAANWRIKTLYLKACEWLYLLDDFLLVRESSDVSPSKQFKVWDLKALIEKEEFRIALFPNSLDNDAEACNFSMRKPNENTLLILDGIRILSIDLKNRVQKFSFPFKKRVDLSFYNGGYISYAKDGNLEIKKLEIDGIKGPIFSWHSNNDFRLNILKDGTAIILTKQHILFYDLESVANAQFMPYATIQLKDFFKEIPTSIFWSVAAGSDWFVVYTAEQFLFITVETANGKKRLSLKTNRISIPNAQFWSFGSSHAYLRDSKGLYYYLDRIALLKEDENLFLGPFKEEDLYTIKLINHCFNWQKDLLLRNFNADPTTLTPQKQQEEAIKLFTQLPDHIQTECVQAFRNKLNFNYGSPNTTTDLSALFQSSQYPIFYLHDEMATMLEAKLKWSDLEKDVRRKLKTCIRLLKSNFKEKIALLKILRETLPKRYFFELSLLKKALESKNSSQSEIYDCIEAISFYEDVRYPQDPFLKFIHIFTGFGPQVFCHEDIIYPGTFLNASMSDIKDLLLILNNRHAHSAVRDYLDYLLIKPELDKIVLPEDRVALQKLDQLCGAPSNVQAIIEKFQHLHPALQRAICLSIGKDIDPEKNFQSTLEWIYSHKENQIFTWMIEDAIASEFIQSMSRAIQKFLTITSLY